MNIREEDKSFLDRLAEGFTVLLGVWCVIFIIEGMIAFAVVLGLAAVVMGAYTFKRDDEIIILVKKKGVKRNENRREE